MSNVIWMDVKGFEETHMVSSDGQVYIKPQEVKRERDYGKGVVTSTYTRKGHMAKPTYTRDGYLQLSFRNTSFKVHRWVAETFIENPEGKCQVNHINGVKDDNRVENLEWCTPQENVIHSYRLGLSCNKGESHPRNKLKEVDVREIRHKYAEGTRIKDLAEQYCVCRSTIEKAVNRTYWSHI